MDKIIRYAIGAIVGAIIISIFLIGPITKAYEYNLAYKNPAKSIKEIVDKYHKSREIATNYKKQIDKKETDLKVTGNAKIEKRPDGTEVISGDKIERHDKDEKTATSSATVKKEETGTEHTKKEETTKPVLPEGSWSVAAGLNLSFTAVKVEGEYKITNQIAIEAGYIINFPKPELKTDNAFISLKITP